ncbi:deoxyguanosinetriphosphate triphosphohydrolase family protein [Clostridium intestinale]|uniref:Deoxyguanosinetriphosphate triphosphohydrolase-like protein n=1 Tax=Clostridium intestinale DSM 6191 TaxID=1121320 RepID=A0A1M5T0M0_9CLOT|nr:dNTP triphosphohydrolase [Clostridium intestinale]SHH44168.1 dGTPase [Clostridium intestinale DSM 6191]
MSEEKFILVKIKLVEGESKRSYETEKEIIDRLDKSYKENIYRYYNSYIKDREIIERILKSEKYKRDKKYDIVFVIYKEVNNVECEFQSLYLGKCMILDEEKNRGNLKFIISDKIESKLVTQNFLINIGLNIIEDFDKKSYVSIEKRGKLYNELVSSQKDLFHLEISDYDDQIYKEIESESNLHILAQKNENCRRAIIENESKEVSDDSRGEFQRDRERITHSKAMRRLVDKAQIFTSSKGDHFRTRMTHTLEVSQIARGISNELKLNNELTEAIALAHDIGHTPFGHQGERTLNDILKDKISLVKNCKEIKMGGFKHNFQGLRVLSYLDEKYLKFEGINLSYQLLEGVLKHTGFENGNCDSCEDSHDCKGRCCDVREFLINGDEEKLFLEHKFPTTLEGQIVNIADEIAQRGHDLDDALASKHIDLEELSDICNINKMQRIKELIEKVKNEEVTLREQNRMYIDDQDIIRSRIVSEIITFFIKDVVTSSKERMDYYDLTKKFFIDNHRIDDKLIDFSKNGKFILTYLEKVINKKVINSFDVTRFDGKASKIIEQLFKAYYENIMLLPDGTLKRIHRDIRKKTKNVVNFRDGDIGLVRDEIKKICKTDLENIEPNEREEYIYKRKVVVRNIVDHISGMTDNYAMNEYKRIYYID